MTHLFTKVYLSFLLVVVGFFALSALLFWRAPPARDPELLRTASSIAELALPPPDAAPAELQAHLDRVAESLGTSLGVYAAGGSLVARSGGLVPAPDLGADGAHWVGRRHGRPQAAALQLAGERWLVVELPRGRGGPHGFVGLLGALAAALALGSYPLARGITRRVERLNERVVALGEGDLGARAPVEGRDEIARLATSFNRAGERIEALVQSQRTLLASASHELRSPLARLRMAAELLASESGDDPRRAELRGQVERDIGRLDAGVEELLVVSRLDLLGADAHASVDLLALCAEEAAGGATELDGEPASVVGDEHSLRHLVRNLLANATRHAGGSRPELRVAALEGGGARLEVADRGPGIPPAERERVFQPFARGEGAGGGGVGLGLAIVREIARHHGGDVRVDDREGGGSVFVATLPGRPASR